MSSDDETQTHRKTMRDGEHDFSQHVLAVAAAKEAAKLDHIHPEDAQWAAQRVHDAEAMAWDIDRAIEDLKAAKRCSDSDFFIDQAIDALRRTHKGGDDE